MAENVAVVPKHHNKFFNFILDHKIISFLILAGILGGAYYANGVIQASNTPVRYAVAQVQKGTLVNSVSGSGQVLASNQISVTPKVSGQITAVLVNEGDKVKAGQVLAKLDSTNAQKSVRDAQLNLQSAQVALQKLVEPPDNLSLVQAQNALSSAKNALTLLIAPPDQYTLTQAQNDVASAQIALQQSQTSSTQQSVSDAQSMQTDLDNAYNSISDAFINVPGYITDIEDVKANNNSSNSSQNDNISGYENILGKSSPFVDAFLNSYDDVINNYNTVFAEYKATPRTSDQETLSKMIADVLVMEKQVSQQLENAKNIFDAITNFTKTAGNTTYSIMAVVDLLSPKINADITALNNSISTLQNAKDALDTITQNLPINTQKSKDAISNAQQNLTGKQQYLAKLLAGAKAEDVANAKNNVTQAQAALDNLKQGADSLDIQNQKLAIQQRENALKDAQDNLADYSVTAPFDGIVASVAAVNGGTALNGQSTSSSTSVATIITTQLLAQVSLNEVDAAKVSVGNKATLTFDAVPDISVTGELVQLDTIGTSSSGVVSYNAKIAFDTQDSRVKPSMSVTAAIITSVDQDVMLVPNAAVKTTSGTSYVSVFDSSLVTPTASSDSTTASTTGTVVSLKQPQRISVEVGSANDTSTEIKSGLQEGQYVVTQTYSNASQGTTTTTSSSSTSRSSVRIPGISGGGGFAGGGPPG